MPLNSRLYASARQVPVWLAADQDSPGASEHALTAAGVDVIRVPGSDGRLELDALLKLLAARGVTRLMVEAGPVLTTAFLRADLIDDLVLFRAPGKIGDDGLDALEGLPLSALAQARGFKQVGSEAIGADRLETFERA